LCVASGNSARTRAMNAFASSTLAAGPAVVMNREREMTSSTRALPAGIG